MYEGIAIFPLYKTLILTKEHNMFFARRKIKRLAIETMVQSFVESIIDARSTDAEAAIALKSALFRKDSKAGLEVAIDAQLMKIKPAPEPETTETIPEAGEKKTEKFKESANKILGKLKKDLDAVAAM